MTLTLKQAHKKLLEQEKILEVCVGCYYHPDLSVLELFFSSEEQKNKCFIGTEYENYPVLHTIVDITNNER